MATGRLKRYYKDGIAPRLVQGELDRRFHEGDFVFIVDMGDLFCDAVPVEWIIKVFDAIRESPKARFLFLTKNPGRYHGLIPMMPPNVVLGATIESNRSYQDLSKAPSQTQRINAMVGLGLMQTVLPPLFVAIEPILKFDLKPFTESLEAMKPWAVAIGYDNWRHKLDEPSLKETQSLISELSKFTTVYEKTIRPAWWE